jgi:hypothetical protein
MYKPREDREIVVISGMIRQLAFRVLEFGREIQTSITQGQSALHITCSPAMLVAMHEVVGGVEKAGIGTNINAVDPFTTRQRRGPGVSIRVGDSRTLTLAQW